jgi:signal transduction histidine kinase
MKIAHAILLSFSTILLLFSITTYINFRQAELVNTNARNFERSSIIIRHSNRFQRNFLSMVSGLRGYMLTNETFFIQTYDSSTHDNQRILAELKTLVANDSTQQSILRDVKKLNDHWVNDFANPLLKAKKSGEVSDSSKFAFASLYRTSLTEGAEKKIQQSLQAKFFEFTKYEYDYRELQNKLLTTSTQNTKSISIILTALCIIAGICIALFIAHYISSRIINMTKMANAIAEGDYTVLANDKGENELSQLARTVNNMAKILGNNIAVLKRQRDELDQFAHIVSHDLKAPLRGIDNVVTWIEEDHSFDLPPKVNEYLALIKGRIKRAENLLHGILSYARIGREDKILEVIDVNELLKEVQEYIPKKTGIELRIQSSMPVLFSERVPLLQVFTNLIGNALKYHDKGLGVVKVYYRQAGDKYEFFIEDDGPGIETIYHEKIFVIFQTLQERDHVESTGVGLSIVKKILDDRGLKIKLTSEPGKGSVFSFEWFKIENYE